MLKRRSRIKLGFTKGLFTLLAITASERVWAQAQEYPNSPHPLQQGRLEEPGAEPTAAPTPTPTPIPIPVLAPVIEAAFPQKRFYPFSEFYGESVYLDRIATNVFYGQLRGGMRSRDYHWEYYTTLRGAGDTRTGGTPFEIYNDNYLFAGGGVDYYGLLPGVRMISQVGYSWDLQKQIQKKGFDMRLGGAGYWEIPFWSTPLLEEIYTSALYVHRYRYSIGTLQLRTVYRFLNRQLGSSKFRLEAGPMLTLVGNTDTFGYDYNRYMEARIGPRLNLRGPVAISMQPYYAWGSRWERPTNLPTYHDLRMLITVYYVF